MIPGSFEQKLEERIARLVSEMDDLLIVSQDSPSAFVALADARAVLVTLESRHAA